MSTQFNSPENTKILRATADLYLKVKGDSVSIAFGQALKVIEQNVDQIDARCTYFNKTSGKDFFELLSRLQNSNGSYHYDQIYALTYRLIFEWDLANSEKLEPNLRGFMNLMEGPYGANSEFIRDDVESARRGLTIAILKDLLSSKEIGPIKEVTSAAASASLKIETWEAKLTASEKQVGALSDSLAKLQTSYNFVALHKGFGDLEAKISKQLKFTQIVMLIFGILGLVPGGLEVYGAWKIDPQVFAVSSPQFVLSILGSITLTFLFLYFFKVALREADACRAQLVQIRLRMTLCQFIESYADFSKKIKESNADALSKFESLIFSGIVNTDEKLPSTFDGVDQLSALLKAATGKS